MVAQHRCRLADEVMNVDADRGGYWSARDPWSAPWSVFRMHGRRSDQCMPPYEAAIGGYPRRFVPQAACRRHGLYQRKAV